tara:strand:+ start:472 stop:909 length:438 start_codon:yes stop_codon:yes gene_type:complete
MTTSQPDLFTPAENLTSDGDLYTLAEVHGMVDLWSSEEPDDQPYPEGLKALSDGRVVDINWDSSMGEPEVYATLTHEAYTLGDVQDRLHMQLNTFNDDEVLSGITLSVTLGGVEYGFDTNGIDSVQRVMHRIDGAVDLFNIEFRP